MTATQAGAVIACFRPKILSASWKRMLSSHCLIGRTGNACLSRSEGSGASYRPPAGSAAPSIDLPVEVGEAGIGGGNMVVDPLVEVEGKSLDPPVQLLDDPVLMFDDEPLGPQ